MALDQNLFGPVALTVNTLWTLNPDYPSLVLSLQKRGYRPSRLQDAIAEKGDFQITADSVRRVLGVRSASPILVANGFKELVEVLEKEMLVNLRTSVIFYELIGSFRVTADHNPLDRLNSVFGKAKILSQTRDIFGEEVAPFSLRLVPKGRHPDSLEWLDVTLEPILTSPANKYYVGVVYRSVNMDKVMDFLSRVEEKIAQLIEKIGGG